MHTETKPKTEPEKGSSNSFIRDVLTLSGGSIIAQALVVLASPVLTRLYLPEAFGIATLFMAIVTPISAIACLRYDVAIMLPKRETEATQLLVIAICAALGVSLLCAGVLPGLKNPVAETLNASALLPYLWCIPPLVLFRAVYSAFNFWQSRRKAFISISVAEIGAAGGSIAYQIMAAVRFLAKSGGLIFGYIFGAALSAVLLGYQVFRDNHRPPIGLVPPRNVLQSVHRYRKFPLFDIWGVLFNSISWQIPALMIAAFFSPAAVGFYALADRIVKVPMLLCGKAISKVFLQRASALSMQGQSLSDLVESIFSQLLSIGLLPALLLGFLGKDIVGVVFGSTWTETGVYLQILSAWMLVWFIASPLSTLFIVLERQELALIIHAAIFVTRIVAFMVGGMSGNIYTALMIFSGSGIFVYGLLLIWCLHQARVPFTRTASILMHRLLYCMPPLAVIGILKYSAGLSSLLLCLILLPLASIYYLVLYKKNHRPINMLGDFKR